METKEKNVATPYDLDGKPPLKLAIPLGLQHVLAMFVGNLTPLLIITGVCGIESGSSIQVALLQNAMLVAGIVTLIQVYDRTDRRKTTNRHGNEFRFHRCLQKCCDHNGKWGCRIWSSPGGMFYRRSV